MLKDLTISRKLTWLNTLVCGTALTLACLAFLAYDQVTFKRTLVHNLSSEAQVVGLNSISALVFNDPDTAAATLDALRASPAVLAASIFTQDGHLFASYAVDPHFAIRNPVPIQPNQQAAYTFHGKQILLVRAIVFGNRAVGTIVVRGSMKDLDERLKQYVKIAAGVLIVSLLGGLLISSAFRRAVADPIVRLAEVANVISREKDYSLRARTTGNHDETAVLIEAFNEMLAQIQSRESELETQRARLTVIIDNAPVGIVLAEAPSGNLILINKRAEQILGHPIYPSGDVNAYAQWHTLHPDGRPLQPEEHPMARTISKGEIVRNEEYRYRRPDGKEVWLRSSAAPVRDKQQKIIAGVVVFSDIDEQKLAQEALLRSEKLAAAGRLAASISHEINNPLESITNLLFLALTDPTLAPVTKEYLAQAEQELARVSQITTQTLRFYRQTTNPTSADIGALLDSVLRLLKGRFANAQVDVVRQYRADQHLYCFEGELRQVFTNLIGNSLDAMAGKKGRLVVRTRESRDWKDGEMGIRISVADTGSGIRPEVLQRIFEPFYSTKGVSGTGLGLWVSKEIISKHRGIVRVKSALGVGTVFSIFLPYARTKQGDDAIAGTVSA